MNEIDTSFYITRWYVIKGLILGTPIREFQDRYVRVSEYPNERFEIGIDGAFSFQLALDIIRESK